MTDGPLPPHERSWRHPSELAAPPLEPPTRSGRLLILSTATVSLLLVGVLAVTMTPDKARTPQAFLDSTLVETTLGAAAATELAAVAIATTASATGERGSAPDSPPAAASPAVATTATVPPTRPPSFGAIAPRGGDDAVAGGDAATTTSPSTQSPVIVTPVGDGLAITTQAAMGSAVDDPAADVPMTAALPSGSPVDVDVVATDGDLVIVSILSGSTAEDRSLAGTIADPATGTYVLVDGTRARFDAALFPPPRVPEGAPIVDDDGRLLGLATHNRTGLELLVVETLPPLDTPPIDSEPAPASSEPIEPDDPTSESTLPGVAPESEPPPTDGATSTSSTTSTSSSTTSVTTTSTTTVTSSAVVAPTTTTSD